MSISFPIRRKDNGGLTPRQLYVLRRQGDGLTLKQIAFELHLSNKTVEWHNGIMRSKLGITNPAQLVKMAVAFGLTSL